MHLYDRTFQPSGNCAGPIRYKAGKCSLRLRLFVLPNRTDGHYEPHNNANRNHEANPAGFYA